MEVLVTAEESRHFDEVTSKEFGIEASLLMEHAALAVVQQLKKRFQRCFSKTKGLILCGPGNNGADAVAVARLLVLEGFTEFGLLFFETEKQNSNFINQLHILEKVFPEKKMGDLSSDFDWVIDGIFGTGLSKELSFEIQKVITQINQKNTFRLAIDVPTGLNSDTGALLPIAFEAQVTVTMGFIKRGLLTGQASNVTGRITLAPLQIPRSLADKKNCFWFQGEDAKNTIPKRLPSSHKGHFGTVGVALGHPSMIGASLLSALAAYSAGSGVVGLFGEKEKIEQVRNKIPIAILTSESIPEKAEVLIVGPGLGIELPSIEKLTPLLTLEKALVLDADALNLLSLIDDLKAIVAKRTFPTILTPHPKEAARLLKSTVEAVEADRFAAVQKLSKIYKSVVILKGKGSLISDGDLTYVVTQGTSALSKGGSGDILAGVVASMLGQKVPALQAATVACYLLGRASEILVEKQGEERSHLPGEILSQFSEVFYELG